MRTGLIPNSFPSVAEAGTRLSDPNWPSIVRATTRQQHEILTQIADAAAAGNVTQTLNLADHLRSLTADLVALTFDSSAA